MIFAHPTLDESQQYWDGHEPPVKDPKLFELIMESTDIILKNQLSTGLYKTVSKSVLKSSTMASK